MQGVDMIRFDPLTPLKYLIDCFLSLVHRSFHHMMSLARGRVRVVYGYGRRLRRRRDRVVSRDPAKKQIFIHL